MDETMMTRRAFAAGLGLAAVGAWAAPEAKGATDAELDAWQRDTDAVRPEAYAAYRRGKRPADGLVSLEKLDRAFEKVIAEATTAKVEDAPAVWLVYNMGFVVKTREALFSIDLVHRRAAEFAPHLDFMLVTHNHNDHFDQALYKKMDGAGKTVVSNFLDNYGVENWKRDGGFTRAEKVFRIKDVEIRTTLTDHNPYLVDFTTAFEIRVGKWKLYHTGDCSNVGKLKPAWGRPDMWLAFPGCGIDIAAGERKIRPARMVFGHLWELGHRTGRLTTPMVRAARAKVQSAGGNVTIPLWGDRVC